MNEFIHLPRPISLLWQLCVQHSPSAFRSITVIVIVLYLELVCRGWMIYMCLDKSQHEVCQVKCQSQRAQSHIYTPLAHGALKSIVSFPIQIVNLQGSI